MYSEIDGNSWFFYFWALLPSWVGRAHAWKVDTRLIRIRRTRCTIHNSTFVSSCRDLDVFWVKNRLFRPKIAPNACARSSHDCRLMRDHLHRLIRTLRIFCTIHNCTKRPTQKVIRRPRPEKVEKTRTCTGRRAELRQFDMRLPGNLIQDVVGPEEQLAPSTFASYGPHLEISFDFLAEIGGGRAVYETSLCVPLGIATAPQQGVLHTIRGDVAQPPTSATKLSSLWISLVVMIEWWWVWCNSSRSIRQKPTLRREAVSPEFVRDLFVARSFLGVNQL